MKVPLPSCVIALLLTFAATGVAAAPVEQVFGGGYGAPGDFVATSIDLTTDGNRSSGKIRQGYTRTDEPVMTGIRRTGGVLRFRADKLRFDLRRTQHGYAGTVRDERGRIRPAAFLVRPGGVPPTLLARYEGTYRLDAKRTLTLSRNNAGSGFWYLELPSGRTGFLYNVSDREFIAGPCIYCAGPEYLHLWFGPVKAGRAGGFRARVDGRAYRAQRLRDYREEEVTFTSADGTRLAGSLFMPTGHTPRPAVVFAHGSNAQSRNGFYGQIRFLAEAYARKGIAALAFDKRGTGGSAGDWETASLVTLGMDVAAGVRYLRSRRDVQPDAIGLTGSSQAGWIMAIATRSVPDVRFIQHRSAASPLGVREQERLRLKLQMEYDKFPPAEIARALRIRDMMDDYAVTGQGWDELSAAAKLVEKEYWMTQFIGGFPAKDAIDWPWLRESFELDTTADFANFRGSWDVMYGAKDPIAPLAEGKAALGAALARGNARDVTIEIVPDADHNYLHAKTGTDREFPGLQRFVPGIHARIVGWAAQRLGPTDR